MGYMTLIARCFTCKQMFSCNPHLVPSVPAVLTGTGQKEPVCRACVDAANPKRVANGLEPITISPGAYDSVEHP